MCGIIGYTGRGDAISVVLDGLKRLEYRGYDSAGIAFFSEGTVQIKRCKGKVNDLSGLFERDRPMSATAIGHTRWATHGKPSEENAHPHRSHHIILVHNGIVENYIELKKVLIAEGYTFTSETDTEVLCHLIHKYSQGRSLEEAVRNALKDVRGAYALAVMSEKEEGKVVGVRKDSPLCVGLGDREYFIASDVPAFFSHSKKVMFLNDGEMAVLTNDGVIVTTISGAAVHKEMTAISWSPSMAEKGGYKHFMLKEIYEQPRALSDTMRGRFNAETGEVNLEEFCLTGELLKAVEKVFIVACGTSWHSSLIGKYMIEHITRVPVEADIASEFRYRTPIIKPGDLFIAITQSGETADTLAAQKEARRLGAKVLSICNVIGSSSAREADAVFYTHSGPEIGVASTKAFTSQIIGLYLFGIALGLAKNMIDRRSAGEMLRELLSIPDKVEQILARNDEIEAVAKDLFKAKDFIYLGRGIQFPVALEGALKLKEITYIHAEGYPGGEMKHGPIALIDEELPVVVLAPRDTLREKIVSNLQEVRSRGGKVVSLINPGDTEVHGLSDHCIPVPETNPFLASILLTIPLQLLSYHIGVLRGCDVDQPRNLAKSVTVE
ncbi:MAG TPA: glutamine--fructose-6-phosphate transaminase (isomerizing) [Thermodesulfovibrionales bacterium]|jgi:glucosamine--fructose-6-phosphate aminotransferase (isomerizing)|nr:glutamine--fructose-6-phosphate transaminase (isomerizing) [Thermodesulfovibrionales bacterium]